MGEFFSVGEWLGNVRADYDAAKRSRFRRKRSGVIDSGSGADYHYRGEIDFFRVMELGRDFDRNDLYAGQGISRVVENTIGQGISVDPKTGSKDLDQMIQELWLDEIMDPEKMDLAGEEDWLGIQEQAFRSRLVDGDFFVLPLEDGRLELVEAHRCRTSKGTKRNVVHGVLLDETTRKRQEYWFTREDVGTFGGLPAYSDLVTVPARDADGNRRVLHVYDPKRSSQTRGVSAFAPIADAISMVGDIEFAELVRRQVSSCFALLIGKEPGSPAADSMSAAKGARDTEQEGDFTRRLEGLSPGTIYEGMPGETLTGFSPNIPGGEYFPHIRQALQSVSINLGLPLILFLLDASETNFSAWRGAMDQARLGFRRNQFVQISRLNRPVYLFKLRHFIATQPEMARAYSKVGDNIWRHEMLPPAWQYIEPMKDAQADDLAMSRCLQSPRRVIAKRGENWDNLAREIVADRAMLARLAKAEAEKINSEFPGDNDKIVWRDLAPMFGQPATAAAFNSILDGDDGDESTDAQQREVMNNNGNGNPNNDGKSRNGRGNALFN